MTIAAPTRRGLLAGGFCLCCLPAAARRATAGPSPFATEEVAEGVHMRRGVDEDAGAGNADAIANIGFVIGRDGVLVVDPGGSLVDGQSLKATIREKTSLPIKYVAMSHIHPDHIFGAAAFIDDQPVFVGHRALAEAMRQRGDYYRNMLVDILGEAQAGTIVTPTLEVADGAALDLGDRVIEARAHATAHTSCDLSLIDRKTGLLMTGDLVFVTRVPSLDGSLPGWLKELAALKTNGAARATPGHGPVAIDWPAGAADVERYLTTLQRDVEAAIDADKPIEETTELAGASERGRWTLFDDYNGRNVIAAYKELEWR